VLPAPGVDPVGRRLAVSASTLTRRDPATTVTSDDALRRAGRLACRGERPCTAWFWDDPTLAPEAPPTLARPMTEAQADAAVAVYLADTDRLCRAARDERAA
jgi:hypothetical protein